MDYEFHDAIRIRALRAVMKPDHDAMIRRIERWYAKEFFCPLPEVQELPLEELLGTWYEVQFEAMSPEERHNLAIYLLEDETERRQRDAEDSNSEEEFMRQTMAKAQTQKQKRSLQDKIAEMKAKIGGLGEKIEQFKTMKDKPMKELDLYTPPEKKAPKAQDEEIVLVHTDGEFEDDDFIPKVKK